MPRDTGHGTWAEKTSPANSAAEGAGGMPQGGNEATTEAERFDRTLCHSCRVKAWSPLQKLGRQPITHAMSGSNGRSIRPDRVTVWFVEDERVGLDVRWGGYQCDRRATAAHERLRSAGHPV